MVNVELAFTVSDENLLGDIENKLVSIPERFSTMLDRLKSPLFFTVSVFSAVLFCSIEKSLIDVEIVTDAFFTFNVVVVVVLLPDVVPPLPSVVVVVLQLPAEHV